MFAGDVNSSSQRAKLQTVFLLLSAISLIYYSLHLSDTRIWFIDGKEPNSRLKLPDFRGLGNQCEQLFSLNSSEKLVNESISISGHAFNLRYNENGSFPACGDYFIQREGFLHRGTVTDLERSLPVAFSILVYHNFDQVEQLLLALYRKHNFYCLHVDKKAASDFKKKMERLVSCLAPNVFLAEDPLSVKWGTFSLMEAELACMRQLLRRSEKWKYFINLTGEEYPLVTNLELVTMLQKIGGTNIINTNVPQILTNRSRHGRFPKEIPFNLKPYKSGTHVGLCRDAVDHIINNNISVTLLDSLKTFPMAEESVFATLAYNDNNLTKFPCQIGTQNSSVEFLARFKEWTYKRSECVTGNVKHAICIVGVKTLPQLVNSFHGRRIAVNKFNWKFQPRAWDCMQVWHHSKVVQEKLTDNVDKKFSS